MPQATTTTPYQNQTLSLKATLSHPLTMIVMVGVFLATQFGFTLWAAGFTFDSWVAGYEIWDSNWYTGIATEGYNHPRTFAFFPLWPLLLRVLGDLTSSPLSLVGLTISLGCYFAAVYLLYPKNGESSAHELPLVNARHALGLLPLVFAPGAWVYASNHTEALFLLLTVLAFQQAFKGQLVTASIAVGLAALTRNQGVFAAMAIGCFFALNPPPHTRHRLLPFVQSGLISGAIFALWPLYQYITTGDAFASVNAQSYWKPISSFGQYMENMLWVSLHSLPRVLWFWTILGTGIALMVRKKDRAKTLPIGLYLVLSVIIWPMQGYKAPNGLRYGAVIFPYWLLLGHIITTLLFTVKQGWQGIWRRTLGFTLAGYLVTAMILASSHYFIKGSWPY